MVGILRVGCAMWTHPNWAGRWIPQGTPSGRELGAYAALLSAVEGNTTFYGLPQPAVAKRWADEVPDDFRFMFKFHRSITHERKLRGASVEVAAFFAALQPCMAKMSPVAIQLPASFGPEGIDVLRRFIGSLTTELRYAVEVRHRLFFDDGPTERALNDMLYDCGADRIIMDTRAVFAGPRQTPAEHEAFENKPRLPVRAVATSDAPIVRFVGQTSPESNPSFWQPWVHTVSRWLCDGRSPTVFIHTPDNRDAPALARQFYDDVRSHVPELPEQSPAPIVRPPELFEDFLHS